MKITELAIDRSTTVFVLLGLVLVAGIYCYNTLPRESEPEIIIPFITVTTTYQGVAPEDMENLVTIPIERKLTGIKGVKEISSTSAEGASSISIEFEANERMSEALQRVRDKVDLAKPDLPDDADDPMIREMNFAEAPIIYVNLTGPVGLGELTKLAEDLEDRIEAIKGVLEVEIIGGVEREIQIVVDPARMVQYRVSLQDLVQLAQVENVNTPAGSMEVGDAKYLMRVPGEIKGAEDLQNLVVRRGETGAVYLRDLAEIREGFKKVESYSRLDGQPSVTLSVSKRAGENIIAVSDAVKAAVDEARLTFPRDVSVVITADESTRIRYDVAQLENSILSGLFLVLIVIFLFLGFSNAFFVALAIPVSLLITFTVMYGLGMSLNMVTLFSLMVALGMLVDNGIVVIENIYRHAEQGKPVKIAAKDGAAEVSWPIFASTITTIAAFFPMLFWPGMMGKFMSLLPKTVIIALTASLFMGLIVNPSLASVFMRVRKSHLEREERHPVLAVYAALLRKALSNRGVTLTLAVTVMVVIIGTYVMDMKMEFLPDSEPSQARINIEGPEGANLDSTDAIVRQVEALVEPERENIEFLIANSGSRGVDRRQRSSSGATSHLGQVTLDFYDLATTPERPTAVLRRIRGAFDNIVGAEVRIDQSVRGPVGGPPVNIELAGEDFAVLSQLASDVSDRIRHIPGLVDLEDDFDKGKPEVLVHVDREQALLTNLNTQYIGLAVQAAVHGRKVGEYRVGDDEYDVTLKFPEAFSQDLSNIEGMGLVNAQGDIIPFSSVASLEQGTGLGSIKRLNRKRMVTISAEADGLPGPELLRDVRAALADFPLPMGYTMEFTGENQDVQDTTTFLGAAFVVAMFLISLVLITQFNSILQPLVIMSSVILSLAGVFFGLLVFNMPFGVMMTGIGCVSLAGIVVNNAIVLVDFINKQRAQGMPVREAIVAAGVTRFRPVMLTAITTILGLIPLAVGISFNFRAMRLEFGGEMTQYWGSMAVAIIFGLAFATVLTLVVVPVLYSLTVSAAESARTALTDQPGESLSDAEPVAK